MMPKSELESEESHVPTWRLLMKPYWDEVRSARMPSGIISRPGPSTS